MNIHGDKVTIRAIEEQDNEQLLQVINNPEIEFLAGGFSFPVSRIQQKHWYEEQHKNHTEKYLSIARKEDNQSIGLLILSNLDWKNRSVKYGIKIFPDFQGYRYGSDATLAMMRYCFYELQMNRIYTGVLEYNEFSRKMFTKCGWKIEGILRQTSFYRNTYHNEIIFSILKDEYITKLLKEDF